MLVYSSAEQEESTYKGAEKIIISGISNGVSGYFNGPGFGTDIKHSLRRTLVLRKVKQQVQPFQSLRVCIKANDKTREHRNC